MAGERITVDDVLARSGALRATVHEVAGDDGRARIVPFTTGRDCLCAMGIAVRKEAIDHCVTTDETAECCGRRTDVVEISFRDDDLGDVFRQLTEHAASFVRALGRRKAMGGPQLREDSLPPGDGDPYSTAHCVTAHDLCTLGCHSLDYRCRCECRESYMECVSPTYQRQPCGDPW
jgi:hypothetical protein